MAIRSAAKVIVAHGGKILVNRCKGYYDLPGGGQMQYETMEEAAAREVLEETGYSVKICGFLALGEEIYGDPGLRERYPDYAHRIIHIFRGELVEEVPGEVKEMDWQQEGCAWLTAEELDGAVFRPGFLTGRITGLLKSVYPQYLGSFRVP